jgi:hypothetical protein
MITLLFRHAVKLITRLGFATIARCPFPQSFISPDRACPIIAISAITRLGSIGSGE